MIVLNPYWSKLIVRSTEEAEDLQVRSDLLIEIRDGIEIMGWDSEETNRHLLCGASTVSRIQSGIIDELSRHTLTVILEKLDVWLVQEMGEFE